MKEDNTTNPVEDVKYLAELLEKNFESHGILTKVVEVNFLPKHLEFQLEIARGTKTSEIELLSKDIALFLASPTGKVEIIIPIPGTSKIGINLPRRNKKNKIIYNKQNHIRVIEKEKNNTFYFRNFIAKLLFFIGNLFYKLGQNIYQIDFEIKPSITSDESVKNKDV